MQLQVYYSKDDQNFSRGFLFGGLCGRFVSVLFFCVFFGGEKNKEGCLGGLEYSTLILCCTLNTSSFLFLPVAAEALW